MTETPLLFEGLRIEPDEARVWRRGRLVALSPRAADLPAPLTSFVGRARECEEVAASVRRGGLTTIAGAGGSGKTRLALEVAGALAGELERVAWVELAGAKEPELVPHLLAAELGVREHAGLDLIDALGAACRARRMLVVLDNCDGRRRLFCDRAGLILPGFDPREPAELALVAQICRRLDGMPLALELAAARLRLLSLEQIAARLVRALDFLASGERAAPESLRLLEPEERRLLGTLGVFAGSFTLEAVEAVAEPSVLPRGGAIGHLDRLVAKSVPVSLIAEDMLRHEE